MEPFISPMKEETIRQKARRFIQRRMAICSIRRADHTIGVSNFVVEFLIGALHIDGRKITRVYHGVSRKLSSDLERPSAVPIGWDNGFLFTGGSIRPARGLIDILDALAELHENHMDLRLIIAGDADTGMKGYWEDLKNLIKSRGIESSVCWAGNLGEKEMSWCYEHCSVFIMTSRVEACPNIALEVLSHGAIAIAADNPPLPEIFSDCAEYYPAGNSRSLARLILKKTAQSEGERLASSRKSQVRSSLFNWDSTAEETLAIFREVLGQTGQ